MRESKQVTNFKSHWKAKVAQLCQSRIIDPEKIGILNATLHLKSEKINGKRVTKPMLIDEVVRMCLGISEIEEEVEKYIESEVESRCAQAMSNNEVLRKKLSKQQVELNQLKEQVELLKASRRKESTGRPPKYTQEDARILHADRAAGLSYRDIAKKRGMSVNTVRKLLDSADISKNK